MQPLGRTRYGMPEHAGDGAPSAGVAAREEGFDIGRSLVSQLDQSWHYEGHQSASQMNSY
ncbi:hypothetical protein PSEUDO8Z_160173 [Pseudomonas sp. 8Z]|nr:hypothetical protein PSEUDO8Z_160173 [Pseudomonas sp. 8Z]